MAVKYAVAPLFHRNLGSARDQCGQRAASYASLLDLLVSYWPLGFRISRTCCASTRADRTQCSSCRTLRAGMRSKQLQPDSVAAPLWL